MCFAFIPPYLDFVQGWLNRRPWGSRQNVHGVENSAGVQIP